MATRLCPITALEPMKILGLKWETVGYATIAFGATFMFVEPFTSLGLSFGLAALGEWLSKGQPGNYLMHKMSVVVPASVFGRAFPKLKNGMSVSWEESGLLPSPTAYSLYEPS
jgi:hypothetical protein